MTVTLIIKCVKCGGLMLATLTQKSKTCPYCGKQVNLTRAQRIASANNAFEASEILRKIKSETGFNHKT